MAVVAEASSGSSTETSGSSTETSSLESELEEKKKKKEESKKKSFLTFINLDVCMFAVPQEICLQAYEMSNDRTKLGPYKFKNVKNIEYDYNQNLSEQNTDILLKNWNCELKKDNGNIILIITHNKLTNFEKKIYFNETSLSFQRGMKEMNFNNPELFIDKDIIKNFKNILNFKIKNDLDKEIESLISFKNSVTKKLPNNPSPPVSSLPPVSSSSPVSAVIAVASKASQKIN